MQPETWKLKLGILSMIKSKIKIHDKFSIVIDITYDKIFKRKKSKYTTITYLFFPNSLNVNHKTYPSTKFYNDVRLFIKYDTPNYNLNDINNELKQIEQRIREKNSNFMKYQRCTETKRNLLLR